MWVQRLSLVVHAQDNPLLVDLVGEENTGRLADTIRLLVMQVRLVWRPSSNPHFSDKIKAALDHDFMMLRQREPQACKMALD